MDPGGRQPSCSARLLFGRRTGQCADQGALIVVDVNDPRNHQIFAAYMFVAKGKRGPTLVLAKHRSSNQIRFLRIMAKVKFPQSWIDSKRFAKGNTTRTFKKV